MELNHIGFIVSHSVSDRYAGNESARTPLATTTPNVLFSTFIVKPKHIDVTGFGLPAGCSLVYPA